MQKTAQTATTICILLMLVLAINLQGTVAQQSGIFTAPEILWQQNYNANGNYSVLWNIPSVSNLIETNDSGFVFMAMGFPHQGMHPSTLFKVDSTGNLQWTKKFDSFIASTIIQTSDGGFEISGEWATYCGGRNATILKTDQNGTIQWSYNCTTIPQINFNSAVIQNGSTVSNMIKTSEGGYAYVDWAKGEIVKTDQNKQTQWAIKANYSQTKTIQLGEHGENTLTFPAISLAMSSLIESSDGALVGLGISLNYGDNVYRCGICLIKTETFLPSPQQVALPTPISTPTLQTTAPDYTWLSLIPISIGVVVIFLFFRKRFHSG